MLNKDNIIHSTVSIIKPAAHDVCFPAGLLAGLESCHCIGCDNGTDSIAVNMMERF